jgi:hypothetical protein
LSNSCTACGHFNSSQSSFCENCGNPTSNNKSSIEPKQIQISLGYSSIPDDAGDKNSFFILDTSSIYNETKRKTILLAILKGLSDYLNASEIRDVLISQIVYQTSAIDPRIILVELKEKIDKQIASNSLNEFKKKGLLISIIDNQKISSLCLGDSYLFLIPKKGELQAFHRTIADATVQKTILSAATSIVFSSHDLENLVGKKELTKLILQASNAQKACENIVKTIKDKIPSISVAIIKKTNI